MDSKKKPHFNHNEINSRIKEELKKFGVVDENEDTNDNSKLSYLEWYEYVNKTCSIS
jgi:hypothetical protein